MLSVTVVENESTVYHLGSDIQTEDVVRRGNKSPLAV
jgi:hypothetical protein